MNIQRAIELWIELTGIDPNSNRFKLSDWDIKSMNDELKESLKLDPSGLITIMLLNYFVKEYYNDKKFTVNEMMFDYDRVMDYLNKSRELYLMINAEDVLEIEKEFQDKLVDAARDYEMDREDVLNLINNRSSLAFVRRDALKSMETLQIHQFTQGKADSKNPKYIRDVHLFWNINSLLKYVGNTPYSSISLNLIKNGYDSYFAFGIRNGGTISILTDVPKYAHPMQSKMSRRPERHLANRYAKNLFPYELMDLEFDNKGGMHIKEFEGQIIPYQQEAVSMKAIKDLEANEIVWIIMMFDLIKEKFWTQNYKTHQLSYTGEMLYDKYSLVSNIKAEVENYLPIETLQLKKDDMNNGKIDKEFIEAENKNNEWMEQVYNEVVPNELLNLINTDEGLKLFQPNKKNLLPLSTFQETSLQNTEIKQIGGLQGIDPTMFGTMEEMQSNQKWYARYNQAKIINDKLQEEYNNEKDSVIKWLENALIKNVDFLYECIAHGKLILNTRVHNDFCNEEKKENKNILELSIPERVNGSLFWRKGNIYIKKDLGYYSNKKYCYRNGKEATLIAIFKPMCPTDLATLCGCKVENMPIPLQHWYMWKSYSGNSILDRVDPMEWVVKNPWDDYCFNIIVYFSKSTYSDIRKLHKLEPDKFWLDIKKVPCIY